MHNLLFNCLAYGLGFLAAIPIGASQIEVAKRALKNHFLPAIMVALGSVSSDIFYGSIAFFGVAPFFENPYVVSIFEFSGAVLLIFLSINTYKDSKKKDLLDLNHHALKSNHRAFITGFSLAFTNPMMIFTWLFGAAIAKDLNLVSIFTPNISLAFITFGALGLFSYLCFLAIILHWAKRFISNSTLQRTHFILSIVLALLAIFFLINAIRKAFHLM
jgi:threonine/homoserine/homoserine lactone efflux protein